MRSAVFLLLAGLAAASSQHVPAAAAPPPAVVWRSWDRGLEEARASGRPILVDVYTDWCGWCRRMKADVYARPEVRAYLAERFVTVSLNAEGADAASHEGRSYTSRSLAARFGVSGYPTTLFLRADGGHQVYVPGYVEPVRFLQVLRFIGEGHMDRGVSFQEFSKPATPGGAERR